MADLHTSEITLRVGLDENRIPEKLNWSAQDGGIENEEAKAMLLSVWDSKNQESLKIDLERVIQTLNPRESEVILLCFGLNNSPILTLDEIAKRLHLTRERVRQIKDKGIRALRRKGNTEMLRSYL